MELQSVSKTLDNPKHITKKGSETMDNFIEEQTNYSESLFESIKHINEYGQEFWYARELQVALEYKRWDKFLNVIKKAKVACANSNNLVDNHFSHVGKMVKAGVAPKDIGDIALSRYACYLIVQNADSRKKVIALGQTYFAVKTRQQELIENFEQLDEDKKRLAIRHEMAEHNKLLVEPAKNSGVETAIDYAIFQNHGYMGLYGGMKAKDIHEHKGLKAGEKILDHMGYEELGGTMPEDLPTPSKSIKQIEREQKLLEDN